ncbi:MAG: transcriptional regulator with XRE-family HTH domain [Phenylobacterium sp.]|jgi:transcriptional regulator with XRE-family HTH domain
MKYQDSVNITSQYENFNHLIKGVREKAGFSIAAMARSTGVHRNTQVNYETDRDPSIDYLVAFSNLTKVSFWQLLAFRVRLGSCETDQTDRVLNEVGPLFRQINEPDADGNLPADGSKPVCDTLLATCQNLLSQHQHNENIEVYRQTGNSMAPTIDDGDDLIVDTSDTSLRDGKIFLVRISDIFVARRFQNLPDGGVLIISDNSQFESIKVDSVDVAKMVIVGRLLSSISHF